MSNSKERQRQHIRDYYAKRAAVRHARNQKAAAAATPKTRASETTKGGAADKRFNKDLKKHGKGAMRPRNALMVAGILEFGKHDQSKNPFLTRSFEAKKTEALEVLVQSIKEALDI